MPQLGSTWIWKRVGYRVVALRPSQRRITVENPEGRFYQYQLPDGSWTDPVPA